MNEQTIAEAMKELAEENPIPPDVLERMHKDRLLAECEAYLYGINTCMDTLEPVIQRMKLGFEVLRPHPAPEDLSKEVIMSAYEWLSKIIDNEYSEYLDVRDLRPEHIWKRYEGLDADEFREVKMHRAALRKLKEALLKRPDYYREAKHVKLAKAVKKAARAGSPGAQQADRKDQ